MVLLLTLYHYLYVYDMCMIMHMIMCMIMHNDYVSDRAYDYVNYHVYDYVCLYPLLCC